MLIIVEEYLQMLQIKRFDFLLKQTDQVINIGLIQHGYLANHLLLRVQMQVVMHMHRMVSYWLIIQRVVMRILHQYFHQLLGGLKMQSLAIQLFTKHELYRNKHKIVARLFMHQMGQLILHLLILLVQEHLHLHLMLHIGKEV